MLTQALCSTTDSGEVITSSVTSWLDQFCQGTIPQEKLTSLLHQYGLLPRLLQEMTLDREIAPILCNPEELLQAYQRFYATNGIASEAELGAWLAKHHKITVEKFHQQIQRTLQIEKYQQQRWGNKLESHFLTCKPQLDQVIYSLIRMQDFAMAQEVFFRIQSGEQSFADATKEFSQGTEAQTGGLLGPMPISQPHPVIAARLKSASPGQVLPPIKLGEWAVVLRLEQYLPAQFDEATQQMLIENLFQTWLQESVQELIQYFSVKLAYQDMQETV